MTGSHDNQRVVYVPDGVIIKQSSLPHVQLGVFSHDRWISEGTEMGPFTGRCVPKNEINESTRNEFMWEVITHTTSTHTLLIFHLIYSCKFN